MYGDNNYGNYKGTVSKSGGPSLGAVIVGSIILVASFAGLDKLVEKISGSKKSAIKNKKKK